MKRNHLPAVVLLSLLILCITVCVQAMWIRPLDQTEPSGFKSVPVWQFCRGVRDGLETAVITGYKNSCEEGPCEYEMTPEEADEIRALAISGVVTGKANDLSVTGGTWTYSFETPEGKHLLSVEMFKGWIVSADGMYNCQK